MPSLEDELLSGLEPGPVRMNVGGVDGIGKSTFGSQAPNPVFICTEKGTAFLNVKKFPLCEKYQDIIDCIKKLATRDHDFKTVVLDTTDWAEILTHEAVCAEKNVASIEDITYGKGYTAAREKFRKILRGLDVLHDQKKMNIILLSHVDIKTFKDPEREPYDRYQLKLHNKTASIIREWVDFNFFANHQVRTVKEGKGFNEQTRALAMGDPMLFTKFSPAFDAKRRVPLPDKIELKWDSFYDEYKKSIQKLSEA